MISQPIDKCIKGFWKDNIYAGFHKGNGTQRSLITMLEKMECCFRHRIQINNYFSSAEKVIVGVVQGLIDEWLFYLFINELVLFLTHCFLSNYADDNNLYNMGNNLELAKIDFREITNWLLENYLILNSEKCFYICVGKNCEEF